MTETATTQTSGAETAACWQCGADVTLADDVCGKCAMPQPAPENADYFALWGVPASMDVDAAALQKAFHARSRKLHPDRFGRAGEAALRHSEERSALLNKSYRTLRDAGTRLDYLFETEKELLAFEEGGAASRNVPMDLAEEFFEMQDALAEGDDAALAGLKSRVESLQAENRAALDALARRWDAEKLGEARARGERNPARLAFVKDLKSAREMQSYLARMEENIGHAASGGAA